MSGFEIPVTITGHLGQDPKFYSKDGSASAVRVSVAFTPREFDRRRGDWVQRPTVWHDVVAFGQLADNVHASLRKGDPVIVVGKLRDNSYTRESRQEGGEDILVRRTDLRADYVGLDLNRATVAVTKNRRPEPQADEQADQPAQEAQTTG
ncbi:single-stranded DNA-binding protein [Pseudonocardia sp. C8]|uniref:single-stranded DNA-binding protein n=1 Tax=Pseudonocardia sp. C8 TaxID=2762759 RepID=UPI001642E0D4|nr:single-stranded DNA-binding protein [Pseudonocardia sp. C8]MBC3191679.1 single-stranded DNA-binding protein [Pseudonocardia sp. C8]